MTIQLTDEDEALIQRRIASGAFHSVEEAIHDALASQAAEIGWLEKNNEAINEKIAWGIAQLDRGRGRLRRRGAGAIASSRRWLVKRQHPPLMSGYILSPEVEDDLWDIRFYLAKEAGIALAEQVESELFDDFGHLAKNPGAGHKREDLTSLPRSSSNRHFRSST